MSLSEQFQIIVFSFLFGIFFLACYHFFNAFLYKAKGTIFRLLLEILFFGSMVTIYFFILFLINDARMSIYLPIFFLLGCYIYYKYMSFPFLVLYEKIKGKMHQHFIKIRLFFSKKCSIIKSEIQRKGRWIYAKIRRKPKQEKE